MLIAAKVILLSVVIAAVRWRWFTPSPSIWHWIELISCELEEKLTQRNLLDSHLRFHVSYFATCSILFIAIFALFSMMQWPLVGALVLLYLMVDQREFSRHLRAGLTQLANNEPHAAKQNLRPFVSESVLCLPEGPLIAQVLIRAHLLIFALLIPISLLFLVGSISFTFFVMVLLNWATYFYMLNPIEHPLLSAVVNRIEMGLYYCASLLMRPFVKVNEPLPYSLHQASWVFEAQLCQFHRIPSLDKLQFEHVHHYYLHLVKLLLTLFALILTALLTVWTLSL